MAESNTYFDRAVWEQAITQPDWYLRLYPEIRALRKRAEENPESAEAEHIKKAVRGFFEEALQTGKIQLADSGPNLDAERKPIDTIVIHHTSANPGYRLSYMNAVQLLNIYVPYYNNPTVEGEEKLRGQPVWSNHFKDGRQIFYAYHWLVRMDGSVERLLEDEHIGWHAGNWDINCRSVGICLDNDYEKKDPEPSVLAATAQFITTHYSQVSPAHIMGHREAKDGTICPGTNFLAGWKQDLVEFVKQSAV